MKNRVAINEQTMWWCCCCWRIELEIISRVYYFYDTIQCPIYDQFQKFFCFSLLHGSRTIDLDSASQNDNNEKKKNCNTKQTNPIYHFDFLHKLNCAIPYGIPIWVISTNKVDIVPVWHIMFHIVVYASIESNKLLRGTCLTRSLLSEFQEATTNKQTTKRNHQFVVIFSMKIDERKNGNCWPFTILQKKNREKFVCVVIMCNMEWKWMSTIFPDRD